MSSDFGYIWAKDPRPGNPHHWPRWWRFTDVFTGKGPDIYVGRIRPRTRPHDHDRHEHTKGKHNGAWSGRFKTGWSLWQKDHLKYCVLPYCDECYRIRAEGRDNFFCGSRRGSEVRYDFRTRRYAVPDEGTWSRKVYCDDRRHMVPRRYWDRYGQEYPAEYWHDVAHGVHRDRRRAFWY